MMTYEKNREHLINLLDDLFGHIESEEEFIQNQRALGELECWMIADGRLTQDQILEIEESWSGKAA